MPEISIMVIDDEEKMLKILNIVLEDEGYKVNTYSDPKAALVALKEKFFPIVLTDLKMPDVDGLQVLDFVKRISPKTEVVIMTAYADAKTAISAIKKGAYDYIIKPFEMDELKIMLNRIIERNRLLDENLSFRERSESRIMIGASPIMQEILKMIEKVAPYQTTVLITGESGTGKELVARAIHRHSKNSSNPFLAISSAAIPDSLLESELFGYEKGAFTGANNSKHGLLEAAGNGTIFLDEIGEISPSMQAKLLRVLQEKEFFRLGSTKVLQCNARIIAATNRDLNKEVKEKKFREDLYYRLSIFPIHIPPLREHREDIADLIKYFLNKLNQPQDKITPEALKFLLKYNWPGNIRELENYIERFVILAQDNLITEAILPVHIKEEISYLYELPVSGLCLEELEKKFIIQALARTDGNKTEAAKLLGITRRALYSRMEKHGLDIGTNQKNEVDEESVP
ncbi:MAG: sigma-54-dependent Fis family transcriptional regulator [Candidatus Firestonebacteria bacterium]|nr:sigma-54-dependent Fis family transcriptional regulator [Candidatus Firestonebacteria bacterium]